MLFARFQGFEQIIFIKIKFHRVAPRVSFVLAAVSVANSLDVIYRWMPARQKILARIF